MMAVGSDELTMLNELIRAEQAERLASDAQEFRLRFTIPWKSADAKFTVWLSGGREGRNDFSSYDSQEKIDCCLVCPFVGECCDCFAREDGNLALLDQMIKMGKTIRQMTAATGFSQRKVIARKAELMRAGETAKTGSDGSV